MARGRNAESPTEIPAKGWKDIALRVKDEISADHVGLIAAGVAFYALLALFPAITAMMALAGLILEPEQVTQQLDNLTDVIPQDAAQIILDQAVEVAGSQSAGLGFAFALSLGLAIYSASKGMKSLTEGLNVAYDEEDERGFIKQNLWTLGLTLFLILGLIIALIVMIAVPAVLSFLTLPDALHSVLLFARWILLALLTVGGLSVIYRYGPDRDNAEWKWLTPGAAAACLIWIAASVGFSLYVSNFGTYNETFGSMAGVIVMLMWLWISAYIVLLGAELNAEMEAQTRADSTVGPDEPMGTRGAEKADKLGKKKGDK